VLRMGLQPMLALLARRMLLTKGSTCWPTRLMRLPRRLLRAPPMSAQTRLPLLRALTRLRMQCSCTR
jgi:hypothetical protein